MPGELQRVTKLDEKELAQQEVEAAREMFVSAVQQLEANLGWLKLPTKLTESVRRYPLQWVASAALVLRLLINDPNFEFSASCFYIESPNDFSAELVGSSVPRCCFGSQFVE